MGSLRTQIPSGIAQAAREKKTDDFLAGNNAGAAYDLTVALAVTPRCLGFRPEKGKCRPKALPNRAHQQKIGTCTASRLTRGAKPLIVTTL